MSSWGERMASVVTACGPRPTPQGLPYHRRVEKVKFGVPLDQVCKRDIPGPLLVMLLKLNKEGPFKKDVFRAPGHQGNMNKLIHFLQQGRLVNIHSFSVNTIASVLKQFLRKIPGGIFGRENEATLFTLVDMESEDEKLALAQRVFLSLPIYSQHLLVLLFGTFRVIHGNSESAKTGMTAEALGVSVAPSFFQTCVTEGKIAKPEEVQKFKVATRITTFFIEHFGMRDLFGRENYEYYARLTGRILKVEDEWIFFTYPPVAFMTSGGSAEALNKTARDDSGDEGEVAAEAASGQDDDVGGGPMEKSKTGSLEIIPENCPLDPNGRLSISLDDQNVSSPSPCGSPGCIRPHHHRHRDFRHVTGDFRSQTLNRTKLAPVAGSPTNDMSAGSLGRRVQRGTDQKTYTCLPQWDLSRRHSTIFTWSNGPFSRYCTSGPAKERAANRKAKKFEIYGVHQKQTERMKYRSEWFLSDPTGLVTVKCRQDRPLSLSVTGAAATPTLNPPPFQPSLRPIGLHGQPSPGRSTCDTRTPATAFSPASPSLLSSSNFKQPATLMYSPKSFNTSQDPPLQQAVRLRRRLSDKDKERRLVRRSSSKRKDKENGGGGSSSSLDRLGSSGGLASGASLETSNVGPRDAVVRADRGSRSGSLKRTGSAEASSPRGSTHALLCRTGSQDTPHVQVPGVASPHLKPASCVGSSETLGSESSLTRSLPRI